MLRAVALETKVRPSRPDLPLSCTLSGPITPGTPRHRPRAGPMSGLRIAATTICLGLRRPRDFNRDTSATIAELYRMADRAGMYSAARRTALPILEMRVARSMDVPD